MIEIIAWIGLAALIGGSFLLLLGWLSGKRKGR